MNLTQDLYEALIPFDKQLRQAYLGDFLGPMSTFQANDLIKIYVKAGGTQPMSPSCMTCKMNLCKSLGRLYFDWKKELEAQEAANNDAVAQSTAEDDKAPHKPKKGAKKGK